MKIRSSFTSSQAVSHQYGFISSVEHKKGYFEECKTTVEGNQWLVYYGETTMIVNGFQILFGYQHTSKYLLLCSAEEEKTHTGLEQMEGKYNNFILGGGGGNYPFKV